ncbi:MAG: hypothetical protein WD059_11340 [Balneolaceae bacterium]
MKKISKFFVVIFFVIAFNCKGVLAQNDNAFLEMISRSTNFQLQEIEDNIFDNNLKIINIDTFGNIIISTENQIIFYNEKNKRLWSKSIEEINNYDIRASENSDVIIVSELKGERYNSKYVLDKDGNEIMSPRKFLRVSEDGKYIYDSNEFLNFNLTQNKIFNSDGEIIEINLVNVLNLNPDPKIRKGLRLRILRNDIAVAIIVESNTDETEFGYKSKLERADLVIFSLYDKEIKYLHSLIDLKNNSTNRLSKINLETNNIFIKNNNLFFHELNHEDDNKLIVVNLESGTVINESVENNLLSYRPSENGLNVLKLEVKNSKRELVLKNLKNDIETNYGIINQIYKISDFSMDSASIQIIQKIPDPSVKDKLLLLDTDRNEFISIEGFFGSINNGIININNSMYKFNRK